MQEIIHWIEIFALISGVIYVVLEILQKNFMWYVGVATGVACAFSFAVQDLYASMLLNIYYVLVSFWGLYQWKKDSKLIQQNHSKEESEISTIHLNKLSLSTVIISLFAFILGTGLLYWLLNLLGDSMSLLDASVTVMSIIATIWLAKSYYQQWIIWIIADAMSALLCFRTGLNWMFWLYLVYTASAIYGCYHWYAKGEYVNE